MMIVFLILVFLNLVIMVILQSTLEIQIQNGRVEKQPTKTCQKEGILILKLRWKSRITIAKISIGRQQLERLKNKWIHEKTWQKLQKKEWKKMMPKKDEMKKILKSIPITIEEFHLHVVIGTKDVIVTSAIIAVLGSLLGILFSRCIKQYHSQKHAYAIFPNYQEQNMLKLSLDSIIQIKVVHIISIIYQIGKIRKEKKRYERTSNRRSYDDCYE